MWERLHRANPRLHRRTRDFADHWYEVTAACGQSSPADRADARTLVRERERELKGARARLTYKEARDRRQGYPRPRRCDSAGRRRGRSRPTSWTAWGLRMLEPEQRRLFLETLRPPDGYRFDRAVGTTFTLDLMALLAVPLAFTFRDAEDRDGHLASEPLSLLESARRHASRITVFCHGGHTAVPRPGQTALAFLEQSVIAAFPRRQDGLGAVFHPKVWVLRYEARSDGPVRYRLVCQSRNLTFDASWDASLVLDGELNDRRVRGYSVNRPLADFIHELPALASVPVSSEQMASIDMFADELRRVRFDTPEGLDLSRFLAFGLRRRNPPFPDLERRPLLVISPFLDGEFLRSAVKTRRALSSSAGERHC